MNALNAETEKNLAAYLRYASEVPRDDTLFWAWEWVRDLCASRPDEAWPALVWLCERAPDDRTLEIVGCGHLQNFLWQHPQFAQAVIDRATADAKFYRAAQCCELEEEDVGASAAQAFEVAISNSPHNPERENAA